MASRQVSGDSLAGRVAIVTGGSGGIGRAICIALAERRAAVAVHYRSQAAAAGAVVAHIEAAGGSAAPFPADLAQPRAPDALARQVAARFGPADILVNNAGEFTDGAVADLTDEKWDQTLTLNLTAAFRCARAVIPAMKAGGWGRIINMSSQAAWSGSVNHAHYAASKAGLLGFTYSLARELGPFGITVNAVSPGRIATDMLAEHLPHRQEEWLRQTPLRRIGDADEIAPAIAFLASDCAGYITGANLHINGGLVMG
jgi:3-oxoacyl-[acyl-carrier protein] reductase